MTRRLHIGGTVAREGWEVLNANAAPYVDHVGNANDLSRFADNTFDAIYASHVIEHLDHVAMPGHKLLNGRFCRHRNRHCKRQRESPSSRGRET